ncbi:RNA polymerase sigma factor [Spongiibacter taiwanensis]|uniref:RNA polymerase sigma factor n=1 Tax=Spongiibacter taiwanensis TaxID=1748242 RepID=UPI002034E349|nr:RNA polymerase sigma factor [Spongiibacter taiwanensis]USA43950.1 RNA polymerase sigma factor [Spongiibacter taiwanensis]
MNDASLNDTSQHSCAPDDGALLAELTVGGGRSQQALRLLYAYYAPRFIGYFRRRGASDADADDLCQEAFVKIMRSVGPALASPRGITAPRAWLWLVARSVHLDHLGKQQRTAHDDLALDGAAAGQAWSDFQTADEVSTDQEGLGDCVRRQFARFADASPEAAQAISWAVVEGFTAPEIASLLGRSPGATREFLSQVRKKLRDVLSLCRDYLN